VVGGAVGQGHGSEHSVQQLPSQHGAYSHEHKLRFFLRAVPDGVKLSIRFIFRSPRKNKKEYILCIFLTV
jgi:hypothetical protein